MTSKRLCNELTYGIHYFTISFYDCYSLHDMKDKNLHEKLYYTEPYICSTQTTPHDVTLSCVNSSIHQRCNLCV
jgi:hypothetical protein